MVKKIAKAKPNLKELLASLSEEEIGLLANIAGKLKKDETAKKPHKKLVSQLKKKTPPSKEILEQNNVDPTPVQSPKKPGKKKGRKPKQVIEEGNNNSPPPVQKPKRKVVKQIKLPADMEEKGVAARSEPFEKYKRPNKFFDMPESKMHRTPKERKIDEQLAVVEPVPRGGRTPNLVDIECQTCRKQFKINPELVPSLGFYCNTCLLRKVPRS